MLFEVFLLNNEASFELDTSMKDPCLTREKSLGMHDKVSDQGFAMRYREEFRSLRMKCQLHW